MEVGFVSLVGHETRGGGLVVCLPTTPEEAIAAASASSNGGSVRFPRLAPAREDTRPVETGADRWDTVITEAGGLELPLC